MIIGIDMGGTHIDGVIISDGRVTRSAKRIVDHRDMFETIWGVLRDLLHEQDRDAITRIQLSTTVSTNAIVEDKTARVGVIMQNGPGLKWAFDDLGVDMHRVEGSIDHRGEIVSPLRSASLRPVKQSLQDTSVEALAVVTKFSTRNPEVEKQIHDVFATDYEEITLGHTMSGKLNFPRRVETAYLNAAVARVFRDFARSMQTALNCEGIFAPVYILKADGGTMSLEAAMQRPVESILSGPAASFMGISALFPDRLEDAVLLDIGGTTTDIFFLVDGVPIFEPQGIEIDGRKTLVRAIFSESIGLGGDSHVRLESGELKIGPKRLGPAAGFGGDQLTPTDALVVLGRMEATDPDRSERLMNELALALDTEARPLAERIVKQFADSIIDRVELIRTRLNQHPVYTIKELLHGQVIEPQLIRVIGGPAAALAGALEAASGLSIEVPPEHEVANAIGAALAKPTAEINLHADTERRILSIPELNIYESIDRSFDLEAAKQIALDKVKGVGLEMGLDSAEIEAEITEASSYNMLKGYSGADRNIRVRAQIKPGMLQTLEVQHES